MLAGIRNIFLNPKRFGAAAEDNRGTPSSHPSSRLEKTASVTREDLDGWPVFVIRAGSGGGGELLYLHGGGYALDANAAQWRFAFALARRTGRAVTVPLYPLTPRHTHNDVFSTLRRIYDRIEERAGASRVAVAGDSAGAGMALALVQSMPLVQRPADLVLLSPWLDAVLSDSRADVLSRTDALLNAAHLRTLGALYAFPDDPALPRVSPINGPMQDLGRVLVFAGTRDLLHLDARRFVGLVHAAGGQVDYREFEGMIHDWMLFPIPEARPVLDAITHHLSAGYP